MKDLACSNLAIFAEHIEQLKDFFETFGVNFELIIGEDGLAHFIAKVGTKTLKICPEHRRAFRNIANAEHGIWILR